MLLFPVWMCLFTVAFTSKCHDEHSGIKGHSQGLAQGPGVRDIHVQTHTERKKNTSSVSYIRRASLCASVSTTKHLRRGCR